MPATIQLAIRKVHGPSLEADEDVAVLTLRGLAPDGTVMDPAWGDRWRAAAAALDLAVGAAETPESAAAETVEACLARVFGRPPVPVRAGRGPGEFILPDVERTVASAAMQLGVALVDLTRSADLRTDALDRMRASARRLQATADALPPTPNRPMALVLVEALRRLGIPWHWSTVYPGLAAVGEGRYGTLFDGLKSLREPVLGGMLAVNKLALKRYLAAFGLPVLPDWVATDADQAVAGAAVLGYPVAVKPIDGSLGRGLSLDVRTPDAVVAAYERARPEGTAVMLEPYLALPDFRAVVVGDKVELVFRRNPPHVDGDGHSTVAQLIAAHNRSVAEKRPAFPTKYPVEIDEDVTVTLQRAGLSLEAVPEAGRRVTLRTVPLLHVGGYPEDVTARTHPANLELFRRLLSLSGMGIAAIDFRAEAVERPWNEQRFGILEFNSRPNFSDFNGHPMIDAIVRLVAPDAEAVRLPTILVVDPRPGDGPADLRRRIAAEGLPFAVAGPDGLWLGGLRVAVAPGGAHRRMTEDPTLAVAIHWTEPAALARNGIGVATIDVAFIAPAIEPASLSPLIDRLSRRVVVLPPADAIAGAVLAEALRLAASRA